MPVTPKKVRTALGGTFATGAGRRHAIGVKQAAVGGAVTLGSRSQAQPSKGKQLTSTSISLRVAERADDAKPTTFEIDRSGEYEASTSSRGVCEWRL
jgi:hypothetical protein